MRKLIFSFIFIALSMVVSAQNDTKKIMVYGSTQATMEPEKYTASIYISKASYYDYTGDDKPGLQEIAKDYFAKMKERGFAENRFKKSEDDRGTAYNYSETHTYIFETGSEEEFRKFINIKPVNGVQPGERKVTYKAIKNREAIIQAAVKDAENTAATVAKSIGKKIGEVHSISDFNIDDSEEETYYSGRETRTYRIQVAFEMKD